LKVDIRLIAASNRDLETEVESGRFRVDLFYRLNVIPLVIPPLRSRRDDIPLLTAHFATKIAEKYGRATPQVDPELLEALYEYDWPGNVRELENLIERLVVLTNATRLTTEFLPEKMLRVLPDTIVANEATLEGAVAEAKRQGIRIALESTHGNKVAAAKLLGISRSYLHRLISELERQDVRGQKAAIRDQRSSEIENDQQE
jgi:DNA-binding NtrC family response regulator